MEGGFLCFFRSPFFQIILRFVIFKTSNNSKARGGQKVAVCSLGTPAPPPHSLEFSVEDEDEVEGEVEVRRRMTSCSAPGLFDDAAVASHFCLPGFFFFLKKQQHLVSETTSTSTGGAMARLE